MHVALALRPSYHPASKRTGDRRTTDGQFFCSEAIENLLPQPQLLAGWYMYRYSIDLGLKSHDNLIKVYVGSIYTCSTMHSFAPAAGRVPSAHCNEEGSASLQMIQDREELPGVNQPDLIWQLPSKASCRPTIPTLGETETSNRSTSTDPYLHPRSILFPTKFTIAIFVFMLLMFVLTDANEATYPIGFGSNFSL